MPDAKREKKSGENRWETENGEGRERKRGRKSLSTKYSGDMTEGRELNIFGLGNGDLAILWPK
jgi:hypothetical protein